MNGQKKNSKLANRIYLLGNILSLVFLVYLIFRAHNFIDLIRINAGANNFVLIGFMVVLYAVKYLAKKKGGVQNPIQSHKVARIIWIASSVTFILGIISPLILDVSNQYGLVAFVAIPLGIYAIYLAHTNTAAQYETEVLDDFNMNED